MAASTDAGRPSSRIAGIEGLRGFAAGAIVLLHAWSILAVARLFSDAGPISLLSKPLEHGVTLFFVLSGFLLWGPFASSIASGGELPSLRRYARNRMLRILPAYWAVLALTCLVLETACLVPLSNPAASGAVHDPGLLLRDALLVQSLSPGTLSSGIQPAWSLSVEVTFYLLVPLLGLLAAWLASRAPTRRMRATAGLVPVLLLVLVSVAGKLVATFVVAGPEVWFADTWHAVIDRSFLTHADMFAAGMLVAIVRVEHQQGRLGITPRIRRLMRHAIGWSAPIIFLCFYSRSRYVGDSLVALLLAVVVAHIVLRPAETAPGRLVRLLERRPLVAFGTVSYSAFLWSGPATVFIATHGLALRGQTPLRVAIDYLIIVGAVTALAAATYLAVERPALRLRRGSRRRPTGTVSPLRVPEPVSVTRT